MIIKQNALDEDVKFTPDNDFFLAAALIDYDDSTEVVEDPTLGTLDIKLYGWGNTDSAFDAGYTDLKTHTCSEEELALSGDNPFRANRRSMEVIRTKQKSFKCYDPSDVGIWGDYNSAKAQQLVVQFHACESDDPGYCKSESEITEYMRGKYILLVFN